MTYKFGNVEHLKRNKEIEGETGTELGLDGTPIVMTVLAATDNNVGWKNMRMKVRAEINRLNNAKVEEDVVRDYLSGVYARVIVKGWRGVTDEEGNAIPFSTEACKAFLMAVDDAYTALEKVIYDHVNFRGARINAIVATAGN